MIRIGILGNIGSGKSFISKIFGYPVFNADEEVAKLYKKDHKVFKKLKKILPEYFLKFPIQKKEVLNAILSNKKNLRKIIKIVHLEVKKKMNIFLKKNKKQKIVILDVPLLLENKINRKGDILIFIQANKFDIQKKLKRRKNFNARLMKKFTNLQLPLDYKRKKSQFIIKNDFTIRTAKKYVKDILKELIKWKK